MKIVAISDTHLQTDNIELPDGDVLIHAGDAMNSGRSKDLYKFSVWLDKHKDRYKKIIYVPGNHDICIQNDWNYCRLTLTTSCPNLEILWDDGVEIDGIKFWGSPWVAPINGYWAFEADDLERKKKWGLIPSDTDVLVTHNPPENIMSGPWGCRYLLDEVLRRIKPKVHIFGHIHGFGGRFLEFNNIRFYNAAICDDSYSPVYLPHEIEI